MRSEPMAMGCTAGREGRRHDEEGWVVWAVPRSARCDSQRQAGYVAQVRSVSQTVTDLSEDSLRASRSALSSSVKKTLAMFSTEGLTPRGPNSSVSELRCL